MESKEFERRKKETWDTYRDSSESFFFEKPSLGKIGLREIEDWKERQKGDPRWIEKPNNY